jgi:hypothetical protein
VISNPILNDETDRKEASSKMVTTASDPVEPPSSLPDISAEEKSDRIVGAEDAVMISSPNALINHEFGDSLVMTSSHGE